MTSEEKGFKAFKSIVGNGGYAGNQQFLLLPCFLNKQMQSFAQHLTLSQSSPGFYVSAVVVF